MKKDEIIIFITFIIVFNSCIGIYREKPGNIGIIPRPVNVTTMSGTFILSDKTTIVYDKGLKNRGRYLSQLIDSVTGISIKIKEWSKTDKNSIFLKFDDRIKNNEGYLLQISDDITISGKTKAGIFYGIQSFLQIIAAHNDGRNNTIELPELVINDHPEFRYRGMHLDVSRHFFKTDEIKRYIDILALHKLNVFHWHLTDDQGWRIEIKKYPKLTAIGAWRKDRRYETWNITTEQRTEYNPSKPLYGGFYTQEEIKEIVKYAQERNITIIPEIEMPGHSMAALVAYPEYSCFGNDKEVPSGGYVAENWDFSAPYCAGNDETFEFLQNILDEVIELFPSKYIHIGGDECSKAMWTKCPKCQARIKNEGLKNEAELQSYFIQRIEKYLNSKGKRIIGWEEILEGGIGPSATIMPWKKESATDVCVQAAKSGHQIIMATSEYFYFNNQWPGEKKIHPHDLSLEKVYSNDPVPQELKRREKSPVIGVEACAWSEYMITFRDVMHQTLPRMAALAEIAWSDPRTKDFNEFNIRLDALKALYNSFGLHYHVPVPTGISKKTVFTGQTEINVLPPEEGLILRYTTDGSEPAPDSKILNNKLLITETTVIKIASFDKYGQRSNVKTGIFEKQDFRSPDITKAGQTGVKYRLISGTFRSADEVEGKPSATGILETITPVKVEKEGGYGILYNGYILAPAKGIYTFYLSSNDGSILKIGNKTVVNNDGFHGDSIEEPGQIALDEGLHSFTLKYFKWNSGTGSVKLSVKYPGKEKQEADKSFFKLN